ncbi:venom acid phosphatase Acph-1-like [Anoplolepis gracilipes]|uniref:venom acid phosphatase Acph-1-like n=1 Tax=Anoplolepis gracilipes TaxID=354296 RepID=UPI003B9EACFE
MEKFQRDLGIAFILYVGLFTTLGTCILTLPGSTKMRLVSAVFRHGDRSVDTVHSESYPNDPYGNYTYYPDGSGQLLNVGKYRAYQFGKMLRTRYNRFLGNLYYQPNIYAHSSPIVRTKMTLQLVLAALYPPANIQIWNPLLSWQPMDFFFEPSYQDNIMIPFACPVYIRLYNDIKNSAEVKAKVAEYADIMRELSKYTGTNITSPFDMMLLYGTLIAESSAELRLPEWTKGIFPNKLVNAVALQFELFSYGKLNRINGGVLLRKIINDMNGVINGTLKDRKINLFSGHDLNVAAMLNALNLFDNTIPPFTSSVIIELHEKNNEFFVKVLYNLGIPAKLVEKTIPGCDTLCPYKKFIELTLKTTATDEELTCPEKMYKQFKF